LQRDAAGSVDAVHRISQAIELIRRCSTTPVRGRRAKARPPGEMSDNAASASRFIVSVGDSAGEIDVATKEAEAHGESVARRAGPSRPSRRSSNRAAPVLLRQGERQGSRKQVKLPCSLKSKSRPRAA